MTTPEPLTTGAAALGEGRWGDARTAFEAELAGAESADACAGLGVALWWLGENHGSVSQHLRAYSLYRQAGDVARAVECAVWLAFTYKSNFADSVAASGWLARADRLLEGVDAGSLHGWVWIARAYRLADLDRAESLTRDALEVARSARDTDLELGCLSQLGLIQVGRGDTAAGFALIDEAMAAVLAGEGSKFDTVVYACCDMLNACELASDLERAAEWCRVADDFVAAYGCPFLYAECRIYYGSVLAAKGRWEHAERELITGLHITEGVCPALHTRALARLAGLRVRQGRLEEAERLLADLDEGVEAEAEEALWVAALLLARNDPGAASRRLEQRLNALAEHRSHHASALDLLVDAYLAAGDTETAAATATRLAGLAGASSSLRMSALAGSAAGRVAAAQDRPGEAARLLEEALAAWSDLDLPFEMAATRYELARVVAHDRPELAVEHARRAMAGFQALGAGLDADRAAALLRSMGVTPRVGPRGVGTLTGREREVLTLLAAGLSNPEIADRIHVSRKTASHHVSSILSKLNLRNRAEAAAFAAGARQLDAK